MRKINSLFALPVGTALWELYFKHKGQIIAEYQRCNYRYQSPPRSRPRVISRSLAPPLCSSTSLPREREKKTLSCAAYDDVNHPRGSMRSSSKELKQTNRQQKSRKKDKFVIRQITRILFCVQSASIVRPGIAEGSAVLQGRL